MGVQGAEPLPGGSPNSLYISPSWPGRGPGGWPRGSDKHCLPLWFDKLTMSGLHYDQAWVQPRSGWAGHEYEECRGSNSPAGPSSERDAVSPTLLSKRPSPWSSVET